MCARRIRAIMIQSVRQGIDVALATEKVGNTHKRQMAATIVFVFAAFLLWSASSIMLAVACQLQDASRRCPRVTGFCYTACHNVFTRMLQWITRTPEFQLTVVARRPARAESPLC
jgi:hypothetical protein